MVADPKTADPSAAALVVPVGARVVHIGPPKTGTTALQAALFAVRDDLADQGVRYPGEKRHSANAIRSVMNRPSYKHKGRVPPIAAWERFLGEIRAANEPRVMISSEFLAGAEPETVKRIVADLDPQRVHVVATLRPLASLLPSQWQQDVRRGTRLPFDAWLRDVFRPGTTSVFWRSHRNDRILADWSREVGADHVTVVALGDTDRDFLLRAFEQLLGLRAGTLQAQPGVINRSLTFPEAEAIRALNASFVEAGLDWIKQAQLIHMGAARSLWRRTPGADEPRIEPPQWALDRAVEVDREMMEAIQRSGVRIMGDVDDLVRSRTSRQGDSDAEVTLSPAIAATMAMGVVDAAGYAHGPGKPGGGAGPFAGMAGYSTREILAAGATLLRIWSGRRIRRVQRRLVRGARTDE